MPERETVKTLRRDLIALTLMFEKVVAAASADDDESDALIAELTAGIAALRASHDAMAADDADDDPQIEALRKEIAALRGDGPPAEGGHPGEPPPHGEPHPEPQPPHGEPPPPPPVGDGVAIVNLLTVTRSGTEGAVFTFEVERTGDLSLECDAEYRVEALTGPRTVTADDFVGDVFPRGAITFMPGVTKGTIMVPVKADSFAEETENFRLYLTEPWRAQVGPSWEAVGTILPSLGTPTPAPTPTPTPTPVPPSPTSRVFFEDFSDFPIYNATQNPNGKWIDRAPWDDGSAKSRMTGDGAQRCLMSGPYWAPELPATYTRDQTGLYLDVIKNPRSPTDPKYSAFGKPANYLGALMTTQRSDMRVFGRWKVRARWVHGPGGFPAIWLLNGASNKEFDIMEAYGSKPGAVNATIHNHALGSGPENHFGKEITGLDTTKFHDYECDVRVDKIRVFIDGGQVWELPTPANFRDPLMLLINNTVGEWGANDQVNQAQLPYRFQTSLVEIFS